MMSRFKKLEARITQLESLTRMLGGQVDNLVTCKICGCYLSKNNSYHVEISDTNVEYEDNYYCKLHRPKKVKKMEKEYYSISCLCLNCRNIFNVNIEKGKRIINSHNIFGQIYRSRIEGDNPCEYDGFLCPNCECKTGVQNK